MTVINLTPHDCHLVAADGSITTILKGDNPAPRLGEIIIQTGLVVAGVPRDRLGAMAEAFNALGLSEGQHLIQQGG